MTKCGNCGKCQAFGCQRGWRNPTCPCHSMTKNNRSLADIGKCPNCDKSFIPDIASINFPTRAWDGHTYKADCNCMNPNLRFCIG